MEPTSDEIINSTLYEQLRIEIRRMAHQMEQKFRLHDKDLGDPFKEYAFEFLDERYQSEWDEFMLALGDAFRMDCDDPVDGKKPSDVFEKGADCCNFILMMCIKYEKDWTKYHQNK